MNLKKVHHIAIIGSNYEESKHFYVDLLGFSIVRENYRPERDDYKIDLQLDGMELELFIIKNCPKHPSYPEAYGLRHLAFAVDSVDDTVRELNKRGITTEPIRLDIMMIVFPVFVHGMLKDGVTSWVPTYINETFCTSASFSILVTTVLPIVNLSGAYIAKYVYRKLNGQEEKAASVFFLAATAALISLLLAGNKSLGFTVSVKSNRI